MRGLSAGQRHHPLVNMLIVEDEPRYLDSTRQLLNPVVDSIDTEAGVAIARSSADAPEIDGQVIIEDGKELRVGDFVDVRIVASDVYDLRAVRAGGGT